MSDMNKAIVSAQSELKNPAMDAVNPHFRSRFASLIAVRDAVLPVFNKHGLAIIQKSVQVESGVGVNTVILHEDGESMDCGTMSIPVKDNNPQAYCSAMTYVRRYTLQSVAGVVGDPDDDGNKAAEEKKEPVNEPKKEPVKEKKDAKTISFLKAMGECKVALGEPLYREILGREGWTSSKEILESGKRKAIYGLMKQQIEENAKAKLEAE
jgi:hypothetical protein